MAKTAQVLTRPTRKRSSKKKYESLSTCPINGIGWCPYPFTMAQLEKKMRQSAGKIENQEQKSS